MSWYQYEDGEVFWWPKCSVSGCQNRICRNRSDKFCYPHLPDNPVNKMLKKYKEWGKILEREL